MTPAFARSAPLLLALILTHACAAPAARAGLSADARTVLSRTLSDQAPIWTSPLHLQTRDARWLLPMGAATGALLATDRDAAREIRPDSGLADVSRAVSLAGTGVAGLGVSAAFYFGGVLGHADRARETGMVSAEAQFDSWLLAAALKVATNRERPDQRGGEGRFWRGGTSFPSGHSITAWAVASVVAREYRDKGWVPPVCYGAASVIALSRFTARSHFPSDVLVGSSLGYLVGEFVFKRRHEPRPPEPPRTSRAAPRGPSAGPATSP